MRLSIFKTLSKKEQEKEISRILKRLTKIKAKLDKIGTWHENETILWKAN